jgi:hypothetical protein
MIRIDLEGNVVEGDWPAPSASRCTSSCTSGATT